MKIKSIRNIGKRQVYDISVQDAEHYVLENGVVTHNTGVMYSSNQVFIIGRSQDKEGTDLVGYNFTIVVEKSRFVKEKSRLTFQVKFDGGINRYSGLMDLALESGHLIKPSNGWYQRVDPTTGEVFPTKYRAADLDANKDKVWNNILIDKIFSEFVRNKYKLAVANIQHDEGNDHDKV